MTPADIERMARESGLTLDDGWWFTIGAGKDVSAEGLARFASLVAAHERERCAMLCESAAPSKPATNWGDVAAVRALHDAAAAIRALAP